MVWREEGDEGGRNGVSLLVSELQGDGANMTVESGDWGAREQMKSSSGDEGKDLGLGMRGD